jgi:hypothetical protein
MENLHGQGAHVIARMFFTGIGRASSAWVYTQPPPESPLESPPESLHCWVWRSEDKCNSRIHTLFLWREINIPSRTQGVQGCWDIWGNFPFSKKTCSLSVVPELTTIYHDMFFNSKTLRLSHAHFKPWKKL